MSCSRNDTALGPSGTIFRIAIFLFLLSSMTSCLDHVGHDGESASIRKYFYAGGHYVDNGRGEHIRKGHIYVEHLTPVGGARKEYPLLFIHGQALSGTVWTPYLLDASRSQYCPRSIGVDCVCSLALDLAEQTRWKARLGFVLSCTRLRALRR